MFNTWFFFLIDQGQSSRRELKDENQFLKDYVYRLNAAASEYQSLHPPDALKDEMNVSTIDLIASLMRIILLLFNTNP